jgi:hypothetical protein
VSSSLHLTRTFFPRRSLSTTSIIFGRGGGAFCVIRLMRSLGLKVDVWLLKARAPAV